MKSIRNWSIRTRLLAAFLGVLIPYLALAGVGAVGFSLLWRGVREVRDEAVMELMGAADLQLAVVELSMPAKDYLVTGDTGEREEFERRLARARDVLARMERMPLEHPGELRALAEIRGRLPQIEALSREILALPDPRAARAAPARLKALEAIGEEMAAALARFRAAAEREIAEKVEHGAALMWRVTAAALAALIVSVAGGVGLALIFARWVGGPLQAIADGSRRMAEGDFSARVNESGGAELGATARAFNLMAERLEASQAVLARLYDQAEVRRRSAEALAAVGRELTQSLDFATVAQQISDSIRGLLGAFQSAFYRLEPESWDLVVVAVSGDLGPSFVPKLTFPRGSGAVGLAVRDLVPVASENVMADPRITFSPELRSAVEQAEFRSVLAVPLIAKGQVVGAISVRDKGRTRVH